MLSFQTPAATCLPHRPLTFPEEMRYNWVNYNGYGMLCCMVWYAVPYGMLCCIVWCAVPYGMLACTVWCSVLYGMLYRMVCCTVWYIYQ